MFLEYGVWNKSKSSTCVQEEFDSLVIILIYLAVYCRVRRANFASFPSNSPGKVRGVFKLYLRVRYRPKKGLKVNHAYIQGFSDMNVIWHKYR